MILVELLDGRLQVRALLALDEQLCDLGAAFQASCPDRVDRADQSFQR